MSLSACRPIRTLWAKNEAYKWKSRGIGVPRISKRRYSVIEVDKSGSVPYNGLQLSFLGTSSGTPTNKRGVTCLGVRYEAEHWIFDCGEGAQHRLRSCSTISIGRLNRIFVTHLHGDHTWGLFGVIASNLIGSTSPTPLAIYGPLGLADFIYKGLRATYTLFPQHLLRIYELGGDRSSIQPDSQGIYTVLNDERITIRAAPIKHSIPCFGYVLEEKPKRGKLKVDQLIELGIAPGPVYRHIQSQWQQREIHIPATAIAPSPDSTLTGDDIVMKREQIFYPDILGRKVVILGDTCDPSSMTDIAKDACVLVHECTLPSKMQSLAISRGHSTGSMAAKFAQLINAKSLVLTHFSPRFDEEMIATEIKQISPIYERDIWAASDFDVLDIPRRVVSETTSVDETSPAMYRYPLDEQKEDENLEANLDALDQL